jgi:2-keto-4-pentenoate hydratase/2-oxohepta-3-ene-1,7-dioic acid hydratase in catechol pathway
MRIAAFKYKDEVEGAPRLGLIESDSVIDLTASASDGGASPPASLSDMVSLIRDFDGLRQRLEELRGAGARVGFDRVRLCAPVGRPGKLVCLAGNYREHITESGYVAPAQTDVITQQLFLKPSTCITGDGEEIVVEHHNVTVGWETELAVVIGRRGKHIPAAEAYHYVFGYTILNDVSERGLNSRLEDRRKRELDKFFDWLAGKWFDTFAPCGPWLVTRDEVADPHDLEIRLTVNGELRQRGNTRDMIFSIPEQIAYISSIMTLEPGDIISTGTPAGAGVGGDASLRDGDQLVCEIGGIGALRNSVRWAG